MNPENNKDVNKDVNYEPLNGSKLDELLKNSKGIESLWKKIKDNKDGQKSTLYSNENKLVEIVKDFIDGFTEIKQKFDKEGLVLDLGKSLASKEQYENMLQNVLKDSKKVTAFKTKFPHWTIQVGKLFTDSWHFKRISTGVSGAKMETNDITSDSNFNVFKKDSKQKTGRESKSEKNQKGILKQISLFWNRHFKKGGWGKASKSKVTIELQKFGKDVNEPWRKWWEVIASPSDKLSNSEPKSRLKEALGKSTVGGQKKAVLNLFNMGQPSGDKEQTPAKHNKSISGFDDNTENFSVDGKHVMFNVFTSLDKSLGNKVRGLFGAPVIEEKSFIKGLLGKKSKDAEKTATATATEMKNLNAQGQPLQTLEQTISSNAAPQPGEASAPGGKYPEINITNQENHKRINDELAKIPKDADTKKMEKGSKERNKTEAAIIAIKNIAGYNGSNRGDFLVAVAKCLGIDIFTTKKVFKKDKININVLCYKELDKLPQEYQKNEAALLIRKIRNIIVVGLDYSESTNGMPKK